MRPDFRSILFVLDKAMKMALKQRVNNGFSQWAGIRIFKSLEEMRDTLKRFSLVIVVHGRQVPHLTSLPRDPDRYLIQIGVPSSVIIRLESFFPLLGKLSFPPSFDLCFAPSVLNIEFDRGQIFDRRFNPATV